MGKQTKSVTVAYRIYARNRSLKAGIHFHTATPYRYPGFFKTGGNHRPTPHSHQHIFRLDCGRFTLLSKFHPLHDTLARTYSTHFSLGMNLHTTPFEGRAQLLRHIPVEHRKYLLAVFNHRDLNPESGKNRGKFHTYHPATDYGERTWQYGNIKQCSGGYRKFSSIDREHSRPGTCCDYNLRCGVKCVSCLYRMRSGEARLGIKDLNTGTHVFNRSTQLSHNSILARHDTRHIHIYPSCGDIYPKGGSGSYIAGNLRRTAEAFCWDTSAVQTCSPEVFFFNQQCVHATGNSESSSLITARPSTDYYQIVSFHKKGNKEVEKERS